MADYTDAVRILRERRQADCQRNGQNRHGGQHSGVSDQAPGRAQTTILQGRAGADRGGTTEEVGEVEGGAEEVGCGGVWGQPAMSRRHLLMERMEAIGRSLEQSGHGLCLLGLGSVGIEQDRLDDHSDLDFFVVAEVGSKQRYIEDLDWLRSVLSVPYHFRNTPDDIKLLFAGPGIFCGVRGVRTCRT